MASLAFMLPIAAGKEQAHIEGFRRLLGGDDDDDIRGWLRSLGVKRLAAWHQQTPGWTMAVILVEADDAEGALRAAATSDDPAGVRFRDFLRDAHGIDFAGAPPPPVKMVVDWTS